MPPARRLTAALVLALTAAVAPAQQPAKAARPAAQPPAKAAERRVKVLIAAETSDKGMVPMVQKDVDTFRRFLAEHLPEGQVDLAVLTDKQLTATGVIEHYRKLDVKPTDALVFYYTGHGSYRENGATDVHTLEFQVNREARTVAEAVSPHAVARPELKRVMLEKKAALTVILTDCCSDHINVPPPKDHKPGRTKAAMSWVSQPTNLGRTLFLQANGEVDLTAASKGQVAVCDVLVGSYFTAALKRAADATKDKKVDWPAYVEAVKQQTEAVTREEARKPGLEEVAKSVRDKKIQLPQAFVVKTSVPGAAVAPGFAAVALDNPGDAPVAVQVRWAGDAKWADLTIAPGKIMVATRAAGAGQPVSLEVRIDGQVTALPARRTVAKPTAQTAGQTAAVYELPSLKPVGKPTGRTRGLVETPDEPPPAR